MHYNKPQSKLGLIVFFTFFSYAACAQSAGQNLDKVTAIYDKVFQQNKKADSVVYNLSVTRKAVSEAAPLLDYVSKNGTAQEQAVGRWMSTLMKYELAFSLHNAGEDDKAYTLCNEAHAEVVNIASSGVLLEYHYADTRQSFSPSEIRKVRTETTGVLAGICIALKRYDESMSHSLEALADPEITIYSRYQNATRLWYAKKQKSEYDSMYVKYTLLALKNWSRIDTANKRMLREKNYFRNDNFASELDYLLSLNIPNVNKAEAYRSAAFFLDSAQESSYARSFYEKAVNAAPENKAVLWQALDFAEREKLPDLASKINADIEKAYAGETDETIKSLGRILPKIVASANDPGRHLKELKDGTFRCKYFHDKVYRSTLELPKILSTCIWEFYKNDKANYYEWMAYIAEEKFADQQGPLRSRYEAICAEVKNIYPDIPVVFTYNDNKYFSMQLSPAVQLDVHIYGSANSKDYVSLTVISEMGKNVP